MLDLAGMAADGVDKDVEHLIARRIALTQQAQSESGLAGVACQRLAGDLRPVPPDVLVMADRVLHLLAGRIIVVLEKADFDAKPIERLGVALPG